MPPRGPAVRLTNSTVCRKRHVAIYMITISRKGKAMSEQMVTQNEVTLESLKKLFEDAYFETEIDDGELRIQGDYRYWVELDDKKQFIRFYIGLKTNESAKASALIEFANEINHSLRVVRACINKNKIIKFDWYVWLCGGLTKRNVIMAFKEFQEVVNVAISKDKSDLL